MLREDVEAVTGDGNGFLLHLPSSHFDLIIFLSMISVPSFFSQGKMYVRKLLQQMNNHLGYSRLLPNDIFPGSLVYIYLYLYLNL